MYVSLVLSSRNQWFSGLVSKCLFSAALRVSIYLLRFCYHLIILELVFYVYLSFLPIVGQHFKTLFGLALVLNLSIDLSVYTIV